MRRWVLLLWLFCGLAHAQFSAETSVTYYPSNSSFSLRLGLDYSLQIRQADVQFGVVYIVPIGTPSTAWLFGKISQPVGTSPWRLGARGDLTVKDIGLNNTIRFSLQAVASYHFIERDELSLNANFRLEPSLENGFFLKNYTSLSGRAAFAAFILYFALEQEVLLIPNLGYGLFVYTGAVVSALRPVYVVLEFDARVDQPRIVDAYLGLRVPFAQGWALQLIGGAFQTDPARVNVAYLRLAVLYNR